MKINIESSNITNSQIGGEGNKMIIANESELEWITLENILEQALIKHEKDEHKKELIEKAKGLTQNRNKVGLQKFVKEYFTEFTKQILTGAAAEVLLKIIL